MVSQTRGGRGGKRGGKGKRAGERERGTCGGGSSNGSLAGGRRAVDRPTTRQQGRCRCSDLARVEEDGLHTGVYGTMYVHIICTLRSATCGPPCWGPWDGAMAAAQAPSETQRGTDKATINFVSRQTMPLSPVVTCCHLSILSSLCCPPTTWRPPLPVGFNGKPFIRLFIQVPITFPLDR